MAGMLCTQCSRNEKCNGECYVYASKGTEYCTRFSPKISKETALKPIPERISDWGPGIEIVYLCRSCKQSFSVLGQSESYCHHCGHKIDWDGVQGYLTPEQKEEYDKIRNSVTAVREFVKKLN